MKLGICYQIFDGIELLEFAIRSIRNEVDFVCGIYQEMGYHGNPAEPGLLAACQRLVNLGLIDKLVRYDPDLSLPTKQNELAIRQLGLEESRRAGCTHHISSDIDEFYTAAELAYAKKEMDGFDCSIIGYEAYYKKPTWMIVPSQNFTCTLIHSVDLGYEINMDFPYPIETTRRHPRWDRCRVFDKSEFTCHHMSFVRRDIRRKYENNDNWSRRKLKKFLLAFDKYEVGDRLVVSPDFRTRRTTLVADIFGIGDTWEHLPLQASVE